MRVEDVEDLPWMAEMIELVRQDLNGRHPDDQDRRTDLLDQRETLNSAIDGWKQSLANPKLPVEIRSTLENDWAAAIDKLTNIENDLQRYDCRTRQAEIIIDREKVLARVNRLADILVESNPARANVELSLFIDRVICHPDGKVIVRICKLGVSPEACELLAQDVGTSQPDGPKSPVKGVPRRRGKPCVTTVDDSDWEAISYFATDPNRFAGLAESFFWTDILQIPTKPLPWYVQNAEAVFRRRQAAKLSFDQLAGEFEKSKPTIIAANKHFMETHPGTVDEVELSAGGQRRKRIDVGPIADEIRRLWWEENWSKLKLAKKYTCATTTIDRALKVAYEKDGAGVPTEEDRRKHLIETARSMLAKRATLEEIAKALRVSDVTARDLLRESFEAEGVSMPDLRRFRRKAG